MRLVLFFSYFLFSAALSIPGRAAGKASGDAGTVRIVRGSNNLYLSEPVFAPG